MTAWGWLGRLAGILGIRALPAWVGDALLALVFLLSWGAPYRFGPSGPADLQALLLFEGLALHATPFLYAVRAGHLPGWALLVYVPFAGAAGMALDTPLLLVLFLWHLAAAGWRDGMTEEGFALAITRYVVVVLAYMGLLFTIWLLPLPRLGWTPAAVPSEFAWERGSGTLVYPAVPAMGTLYFTVRAVWHIVWWHWERTGALEGMAAATDGPPPPPPGDAAT